MRVSLADCEALDAKDPLAGLRASFELPEQRIYLDGNSLGALPRAVPAALADVVRHQWGRDLISSWNDHHWIDLPVTVGEKIASLIGAAAGQVVATDSTSVNIFKLLAAALRARPGRRVILSAEGNFPTDLYMAEGLAMLLGEQRCELRTVPVGQLVSSVDDTTAVVMLTQVDFRTGELLDMQTLTRAAQARGALSLWDLAHSAGALPVQLDAHGVDLAAGCGYKFLNGGPGAPAFVYVASRHQQNLQQPLTGWMGHARAFDFAPGYEPAAGISRFLTGTPSVLAMRTLDVALDVWRDVDMAQVRHKSLALSRLFMALVAADEDLRGLQLASPADDARRGSQVAFAHPQAYSLAQALIDAGVTGDFREPDLLRFGITPLYTRFVDIWQAVRILRQILRDGRHHEPRFQQRQRVT